MQNSEEYSTWTLYARKNPRRELLAATLKACTVCATGGVSELVHLSLPPDI